MWSTGERQETISIIISLFLLTDYNSSMGATFPGDYEQAYLHVLKNHKIWTERSRVVQRQERTVEC